MCAAGSAVGLPNFMAVPVPNAVAPETEEAPAHKAGLDLPCQSTNTLHRW